jgi:hypothetical protein
LHFNKKRKRKKGERMNKEEEKDKSEQDWYYEKNIDDLFKDIKEKINQLCEKELKIHRIKEVKYIEEEEEEDENIRSIAIPCDYILGCIIVTLYDLTTINNGRRSSGCEKFKLTSSIGTMGIQFSKDKNRESCLELIPLKTTFKDHKEKEKEIEKCKNILLTSMKRFRTMYDKYVVERSWHRIENPIDYPEEDFWIAFECDESAIIETEDLRIDISRLMNAIYRYLGMEGAMEVQSKQARSFVKPLYFYIKRFELYKKLDKCGLKNLHFFFMKVKRNE